MQIIVDNFYNSKNGKDWSEILLNRKKIIAKTYAITRASGYRFFHILKALMLCTIIIVL